MLASNDTADRSLLSSAVHSSLSVHDLCDICVSVDTAFAAFSKLKPSKRENSTLPSDHFIKSSSVIALSWHPNYSMHASMPPKRTSRRLRGYLPESQERVEVGSADEEPSPPQGVSPPPGSARVDFIKSSSVIAPFLASFVMALLHHCYMPSVISGCTLIPIPKPGEDPSCSDNYCAIVLASMTSKIIEWIILLQCSQYFSTSDLQFGFKPGIRYLSCDSRVFGCFLDASKVFHLVNHTLLFQHLLDRCLPKPIVLFLLNWYSSQQVSVKWSSSLSALFTVQWCSAVWSTLSYFICHTY